jgi:hypothetical protein
VECFAQPLKGATYGGLTERRLAQV